MNPSRHNGKPKKGKKKERNRAKQNSIWKNKYSTPRGVFYKHFLSLSILIIFILVMITFGNSNIVEIKTNSNTVIRKINQRWKWKQQQHFLLIWNEDIFMNEMKSENVNIFHWKCRKRWGYWKLGCLDYRMVCGLNTEFFYICVQFTSKVLYVLMHYVSSFILHSWLISWVVILWIYKWKHAVTAVEI